MPRGRRRECLARAAGVAQLLLDAYASVDRPLKQLYAALLIGFLLRREAFFNENERMLKELPARQLCGRLFPRPAINEACPKKSAQWF